MKTPGFWYAARPTTLARLLQPLSAPYAAAVAHRLRRPPAWRPPVPVVCVGNIVAGGAGKTPVAIDLLARLRTAGIDAHALSRGHGGRERGPLRVDRARHGASDVGDEPLLLAAAAPTWIARDRAAGARAAVAAGAGMLVLDDGHQNPSLAKTLSIVVADGHDGFGNGLVLPAGPLREPVAAGLSRADALVVMGEDRRGLRRLAESRDLPCLGARLVPDGDSGWLRDQPVLAFAGIGRPDKFFATLVTLGARLAGTMSFPDHHRYTADTVMRLVERAAAQGAIPITTAKDHVRLPAEARAMVRQLPVRVAWDEPAALEALLGRNRRQRPNL
jgi:tetraacyldisaccharide 4'-kinase